MAMGAKGGQNHQAKGVPPIHSMQCRGWDVTAFIWSSFTGWISCSSSASIQGRLESPVLLLTGFFFHLRQRGISQTSVCIVSTCYLIIESQDGNLKLTKFHPPAMGRGIFHSKHYVTGAALGEEVLTSSACTDVQHHLALCSSWGGFLTPRSSSPFLWSSLLVLRGEWLRL